jgi:hypothetical protein
MTNHDRDDGKRLIRVVVEQPTLAELVAVLATLDLTDAFVYRLDTDWVMAEQKQKNKRGPIFDFCKWVTEDELKPFIEGDRSGPLSLYLANHDDLDPAYGIVGWSYFEG